MKVTVNLTDREVTGLLKGRLNESVVTDGQRDGFQRGQVKLREALAKRERKDA